MNDDTIPIPPRRADSRSAESEAEARLSHEPGAVIAWLKSRHVMIFRGSLDAPLYTFMCSCCGRFIQRPETVYTWLSTDALGTLWLCPFCDAQASRMLIDFVKRLVRAIHDIDVELDRAEEKEEVNDE